MSQGPTATSDFETRFVQALNQGGLLLLTSIGQRTGLLNALAGQAPLTSQALAERSGLQERYVREWLGGMVAAEVVETDPGAATCWLPDERALAYLEGAGFRDIRIHQLEHDIQNDYFVCRP